MDEQIENVYEEITCVERIIKRDTARCTEFKDIRGNLNKEFNTDEVRISRHIKAVVKYCLPGAGVLVSMLTVVLVVLIYFLLSGIPEDKQFTSMNFKKSSNLSKYPTASAAAYQDCSTEITCSSPQELQNTRNTVTEEHSLYIDKDLDIKSLNPTLNGNTMVVAVLMEGEAVFSHMINKTDTVLKISKQGKVTDQLYTCNTCQVDGLIVIKTDLYVLVENLIIKIDLVSNSQSRHNIKLKCIKGAINGYIGDIIHTILLLAGNNGVFTYKWSTKELSRKVRITLVSSVSWIKQNDEIFYVVCQMSNEIIYFYNADWRKVRSLGDETLGSYIPLATLPTPDGTILISNKKDNMIKPMIAEYTVNGQLVRYVIQAENNIVRHFALAKPYLWTVEHRNCYRYKIY